MQEQPVKPQTFLFPSATGAPNNPTLPVLIYRKILNASGHDLANRFATCFENHDWRGLWRDGIYNFRHYHSNAHEALGISKGRVKLELGGDAAKTFILRAGDLAILPAGTAHCNLGSSDDLLVIGAYPKGQENYDICRGMPGRAKTLQRISKVALPTTDPFYGVAGPLLKFWAPL